MNILVTGASGFIGNNLIKHLESQGHNVKGLSRNPSANLIKLPCYKDKNSWCRLLQGVNSIVHCAGRAHIINDTSNDPLKEFRQVNVADTISLAKLAIEARVERFIFFSSLGVLGSETDKVPLDENSPYNPAYDYAVSKVEAEKALRCLFKGTCVQLVIIRPPLVYSEHAPGNFARLIKLAKSGIPLPFRGVHNRRSLVSITNLVEFTELCCTHKDAASEDFVVCDDEVITTSEIIECLRVGMSKNKMTFYFPDFLLSYFFRIIGKIALYNKVFGSLEVSNIKAKKLLGWSPNESTYIGLKKVGGKYKNDRSTPNCSSTP